MSTFDVQWARSQFPALDLMESDRPLVFFDNPGGTQVTSGVIAAVSDYYQHRNANIGGAFATSRRTDETVLSARSAIAAMLNASEEELVFGANMTTLTFHLARS